MEELTKSTQSKKTTKTAIIIKTIIVIHTISNSSKEVEAIQETVYVSRMGNKSMNRKMGMINL